MKFWATVFCGVWLTVADAVAGAADSATASLPAAASAPRILPQMTREEASRAMPVCVTGVVTMASSWRPNSCVIAPVEEPNGKAAYVSGDFLTNPDATLEGMDAIAVGQVVEVTGETAALLFAPGITAKTIRFLGTMALPPPPERTLTDFVYGRRDNERAILSGVLMEAQDGSILEYEHGASRYTRLVVAAPEGTFVAHVPGETAPWEALVDAEVRLAGCAMSFFNLRAEFGGVQLEVMDARDVEVVSPPPAPFDLPETPLDALFSRGDNHRVKVRGVVTFAKPGEFFYIQRGELTLKVRAAKAAPPLRPGDEVEAAGFPQMANKMGELVAAEYRVVGHGEPPATITEYATIDYLPMRDGKVVNFDGKARVMEGRWVRLVRGDGEDVAYIEVAGSMVKVRLGQGEAAGRRLKDGQAAGLRFPLDWDEWHPTVRVTGVCAAIYEEGFAQGRHLLVKELEMLVDGEPGHGIELVRDDAWREHERKIVTERRMLGFVAALVFVVVALLFHWWRQREKWAREKREMELLFAERLAIAQDLHDNLQQYVASVRFWLASAENVAGDAALVMEKVKGAKDSLGLLHLELRKMIASLAAMDERSAG